ncbi:hypothetical protein ECP030230813_4639, partial [Escherichia coli P0302308.13]
MNMKFDQTRLQHFVHFRPAKHNIISIPGCYLMFAIAMRIFLSRIVT